MIYSIEDNKFDMYAWRGMSQVSVDELYELLNDADYRVRTLAAKFIQTDYPTRRSFEVAKNMTQSNVPHDREIGAYILGQFGTPGVPFSAECLELLEHLLEDKDDEVLSTTICALNHIGSRIGLIKKQALIEKVLRFSTHENNDVRLCVALCISSLQQDSNTKEALNQLLNDSNDDVVEWAEFSLEIINERNS